MNFTVKTEEKLFALGKRFKGALPSFFRQAGAYIRTVAKNSIKKKSDHKKHSTPGTPPFAHGSKNGGMDFKKSILFLGSEHLLHHTLIEFLSGIVAHFLKTRVHSGNFHNNR